METALAPAAQLDCRAESHQLIDQIQDQAVLRAVLLLLTPHVVVNAAGKIDPHPTQKL